MPSKPALPCKNYVARSRQTPPPVHPPEGIRLRRAGGVFRYGLHPRPGMPVRPCGGRGNASQRGGGDREEWFNTAAIRPYVRLNENECTVMPNHMHAIVWIVDNGVGATGRSPLRLPSCTLSPDGRSPLRLPSHAPSPNGPKHASVGAIMAGFKSATAKRINLLRAAPGTPVWQRNYCEHVDRNERELTAIREYILAIPPGGTTTKTTRATNRIWPQPCIEPLDSGGQHLDSHLQESIMVASRPVRTTKKPVTRSVK